MLERMHFVDVSRESEAMHSGGCQVEMTERTDSCRRSGCCVVCGGRSWNCATEPRDAGCAGTRVYMYMDMVQQHESLQTIGSNRCDCSPYVSVASRVQNKRERWVHLEFCLLAKSVLCSWL